MAHINLLPWRDWERRRRRRRFAFMLLMSLAVGIGIVIWATQMVNSAVSGQEARNTYLRRQVADLDQKIKTINSLKATRESLLIRMKVIERLEASRPLIVHLFDQLTRTVPDSVYLRSVVNRAGNLVIQGVAQSPAGVSTYMRNVASSQWLGAPNLEVVRTTNRGGRARSTFTVTTKLLEPGEEDSGGDGS